MDPSDDEDFYDSDQSDGGNKSLHAMLKRTLYEPDDELEEFGRRVIGGEDDDALDNVQEEIIGQVIENVTREEVALGPVNSEHKVEKRTVESATLIERKLDEAEPVVLAPEVMRKLDDERYIDELDNDSFEPMKKKPRVSHDEDDNPHKTIVMHVPQFIRCSRGGQSIQVRNIVCGANLGCPLDLVRIVMWTSNSEYNPQRFNGLVMRLRTPNITSLLFPSGKMIMQGAKDDRTGNLGCRKVAKILERLGHNVKLSDYTVHNIVCTWDVGFPIMLEELNTAHAQFTSFEPEVFPALVYRMVKPRAVFLMFVNGKIVLTVTLPHLEAPRVKLLPSFCPTNI